MLKINIVVNKKHKSKIKKYGRVKDDDLVMYRGFDKLEIIIHMVIIILEIILIYHYLVLCLVANLVDLLIFLMVTTMI